MGQHVRRRNGVRERRNPTTGLGFPAPLPADEDWVAALRDGEGNGAVRESQWAAGELGPPEWEAMCATIDEQSTAIGELRARVEMLETALAAAAAHAGTAPRWADSPAARVVIAQLVGKLGSLRRQCASVSAR